MSARLGKFRVPLSLKIRIGFISVLLLLFLIGWTWRLLFLRAGTIRSFNAFWDLRNTSLIGLRQVGSSGLSRSLDVVFHIGVSRSLLLCSVGGILVAWRLDNGGERCSALGYGWGKQ